jgi:hypothetical protein
VRGDNASKLAGAAITLPVPVPPGELETHPLANIFPLLEGAAFEELVADIGAYGLREDITLFDNQILDGRNRYRACIASGVEPRFRDYVGDDPIAFVISANLKRRHLSESQRAMIAAKLATLRNGQRSDLVQGLPIGRAASLLNVGERSVARAREVLEHGSPELQSAVETGEVSVSGAVQRIRRGNVTGVAMSPYSERGLDLYETPPEAVHALLRVESFSGPIWEPACGPGAIVSVLRQAGHKVVATDIKDYGCPDSAGGVDFLSEQRAPPGVETILTNPPFMHAPEFVRHALALAPRVVMLLRLLFLEGQSRCDIIDGGQLPRVYMFIDRLQMMRRGSWDGPRNESSQMALAWFVWDRNHRGPITVQRIRAKAEYNASHDFTRSANDCYAAIRERVAGGAPP